MVNISKGIYEHFKGKRYEVIDFARHSETMEVMVIYKALYRGEFPEGSLWVRPLAMFMESVTRDGKTMPRFSFIGSDTYTNDQKTYTDHLYGDGPKTLVGDYTPAIRYIAEWRLRKAISVLSSKAPSCINKKSNILILCSGDGNEGSILKDMGYEQVTVSDISKQAVQVAKTRDARLAGIVINAQQIDLSDKSYDIVVVQDGLHHLKNPVLGMTEMLRVASKAIVFLEPHDSWMGRNVGTKWEKNGQAVNYVFRWKKRILNDLACSYLGRDNFKNLSFSFWHHNPIFFKLSVFGGGYGVSVFLINTVKAILDALFGFCGNQFCGIIVKTEK